MRKNRIRGRDVYRYSLTPCAATVTAATL